MNIYLILRYAAMAVFCSTMIVGTVQSGFALTVWLCLFWMFLTFIAFELGRKNNRIWLRETSIHCFYSGLSCFVPALSELKELIDIPLMIHYCSMALFCSGILVHMVQQGFPLTVWFCVYWMFGTYFAFELGRRIIIYGLTENHKSV